MTQTLVRPITNRLLTLLALLSVAPLLLLLIDLPPRGFQFSLLGAPVFINITADTLLMTLLPVLAVTGADWLLRDHPSVQRGELPFLFPFWVAPGLAALALAIVLSAIESWPVWIVALVIGVIAIAVLLHAEFVTLTPGAPGYAGARLIVTALTYVIGFALFTAIYAQRERTAISAVEMMLVGFVLAMDLLAPQLIGLRTASLYAAIITFILGQATWAMNVWSISEWSAGVLLVAIFYVSIGLVQQHLQGSITRTVLAEYGAVSVLALVVVAALAGAR
jgi:Protein of unknown function (DUF5656)